ncbi:hypothetical protein LIY65_05370 [Megamonas funiformis]|uniref:Uncharacterized protein n=1 Tax=Megamonas funiformis TaxID=437897 RepID=A0AAW4U0V6_9FIRM|nr:hypothetical protein [Megamonas funiformis]
MLRHKKTPEHILLCPDGRLFDNSTVHVVNSTKIRQFHTIYEIMLLL